MVEKRQNVRFLSLAALFGALLAILCPWTLPIGSVGVTLATFSLLTLALSVSLPLSLTATALYLALGALGMPVFSHFTGGFAQFISPSGGFLLGYLPFVAIAASAQYAKKNVGHGTLSYRFASRALCHRVRRFRRRRRRDAQGGVRVIGSAFPSARRR